VRYWPGLRSHLRSAAVALVPLAIVKFPAAAILAAAAGIPVLLLVLVAAAVAMGAAFGRSAERRRACLQTLQALLRLVPWTDKRQRPPRHISRSRRAHARRSPSDECLKDDRT
jgi:hypothetical protein